MRTWNLTLVMTLGLCAAQARADEQLKSLPAAAAPESLSVPDEHPTAGSACGPSCGSACQHGNNLLTRSCNLLAWLTYRPIPSSCCHHYTGPRPTPVYFYFQNHPCHEGCAPTCVKPAGESCADGTGSDRIFHRFLQEH